MYSGPQARFFPLMVLHESSSTQTSLSHSILSLSNRLSNSLKIDSESALVIFKEDKCLNTISFSIAEK